MTNQSDLDKAHEIVCQEYKRHRDAGGTASSPYVFYLMHQQSLRRMLKAQGRGDFELYEMQITGADGRPAVVDLRALAPDVFGELPSGP